MSTTRAPAYPPPLQQAHLARRRNTVAREALVVAAKDAFPELAGAETAEILQHVTADLERRAARRRRIDERLKAS